MKDSQQIIACVLDITKYIKANNERFSTKIPSGWSWL